MGDSGNTTATATDQLGEAAGRASARIASGAHHLQDTVKRNVAESKEKIGEVVDTAASRVEDAHAFLSQQAREKPLQTTAIAVGAGMLLGLLLAKRR